MVGELIKLKFLFIKLNKWLQNCYHQDSLLQVLAHIHNY